METAAFLFTFCLLVSFTGTAVGDECAAGTYSVMNDPTRSVDDTYQTIDALTKCDDKLVQMWYRFEGNGGIALPEACTPFDRCRTHATGWMTGGHPTQDQGIVVRKVCYSWQGNCCKYENNILVRNCGTFYVYFLRNPPFCKFRYCTDPRAMPPTPQPVDGGWSEWSAWGDCSKTCGGGQRRQSRSCTNPPPAHGGKSCDGQPFKIEACNEQACPVDGGWTEWTNWGDCDCDAGTKTRTRTCTNPPPSGGGEQCQGKGSESKNCEGGDCGVDGGWTEWTNWGDCDCDAGTKTRTRTCTNPPPSGGGEQCQGKGSESKNCEGGDCGVDGGWTKWSKWGDCDCDAGTKTRTRTCTNPPPSGGGEQCQGKGSESKDCKGKNCGVDGGWTKWSKWSKCDCDTRTKERTRKCTNPPPSGGGKPCKGEDSKTKKCKGKKCGVNGGWTQWSKWGDCDCKTLQKTRTRSCTNPPPSGGGNQCKGEDESTKQCKGNNC